MKCDFLVRKLDEIYDSKEFHYRLDCDFFFKE